MADVLGLLIIFAGILFTSPRCLCTALPRAVIPLGRAWRLTLVILTLTALIVLGAVEDYRENSRTSTPFDASWMPSDILQQRLLSVGVEVFGPDGSRDLSRWFPDRSKLFGHARTVVGTASVSWPTPSLLRSSAFFSPGYDPGLSRWHRAARQPSLGGRSIWMKWAASCALVAGQATCSRSLLALLHRLRFIYWEPVRFFSARKPASSLLRHLRANSRGRFGKLVAMPLGVSMLIWAVGIYTVMRSIEGTSQSASSASGVGTASGMDTGGHRPVQFAVRRVGALHCDAIACS